MKKQLPIIKILIHAGVVLIATAVASTARAEGATAFGDFNNDGLVDKATLTSPTTITVSLANPDGSYTVCLYGEGPGRIAQKLGEEGVELALAAVSRDDDAVLAESADLLYHLLLLLKARGLSLARAVAELTSRHEE